MSSPSTAYGTHDGPRGGLFPFAVEDPLGGAAQHRRELFSRLPPDTLRPCQDLRRVPLPKPSKSIEFTLPEVGDVSDQRPEATSASSTSSVVHGTQGYHSIPEGVKADLAEGAPAADPGAVVLQASPVADRIRAYVDERRKVEPSYSRRKLSVAAGLNSSQLTMILRRLDDGADIDAGILESIAKEMGRTLSWLLTGKDAAPAHGVQLRDLPGWAKAAADARARYPRLTDQSIARLGAVTVPAAPRSLEPSTLIALATALDIFLDG